MDPKPLPGLEFELTYRVRTVNPLEPTAGSPYGAKQYWQVSEATLEGPRLSAKLASTGMDWMLVGADGFWRPDVHAQFVTDDGAVILMRTTRVSSSRLSTSKAPRAPTSRRIGPINTRGWRFGSRLAPNSTPG